MDAVYRFQFRGCDYGFELQNGMESDGSGIDIASLLGNEGSWDRNRISACFHFNKARCHSL